MNLRLLGLHVQNMHKNTIKRGNAVHLQFRAEGSIIHTAQAVSTNNFWVRPLVYMVHTIFFLFHASARSYSGFIGENTIVKKALALTGCLSNTSLPKIVNMKLYLKVKASNNSFFLMIQIFLFTKHGAVGWFSLHQQRIRVATT